MHQKHEKDAARPETRPCIICECELESAFGDETHFQPYKGGEVTFYFHYGSCKFDLNMFGTKFVGIICDDCAEKCVERMKMTPDPDVSDQVPELDREELMYQLKRYNEGTSPKQDRVPSDRVPDLLGGGLVDPLKDKLFAKGWTI